MTVAIERRLQRLEESLGPAEAAAMWLGQAKAQHAGLAAYLDWLQDNPAEHPVDALSGQVAAWARTAARGEHDRLVTERVERAVRSALTRVFLVQELNNVLNWCRDTDQHELELLQDLAPCVLPRDADRERRARWLDHLTRLLTETMTWLEAGEEMGRRYFAGESPLFAEAEEHLGTVRAGCEALVDAHNWAIGKRRRRATERIDVATLHAQAIGQVDIPIAQLVDRARAHVVALVRERPNWLKQLVSGVAT